MQCGFRFLRDAETRYSVTELEMAAVTWAMKCHLFLILKTTERDNIEDVDFHQGLTEIRNTRHSQTLSPAQILSHRPLRVAGSCRRM